MTNKNLCYSLLFALLLGVLGCNSNKPKEEENAPVPTADTVHAKKIETIVRTIPSPLQVAAMLRQSGAKYMDDILNPASNVSKYSTNFSRSLALGIYTADLAYAAMMNKTQKAVTCMEAVLKVTDGMGMTEILESTNALKRFQGNLANQDSLVEIIAELEQESDAFLQEDKRLNTATLVLTGGWLEGLYIGTKLIEKTPNEMLTKRIGEQKLILNSLITLLSEYPNEPDFVTMVKDLKELQPVYEKVGMNHTEQESSTDEKTKVTTLGDKSEVMISPELLKEISAKVDVLRNKIINNK